LVRAEHQISKCTD